MTTPSSTPVPARIGKYEIQSVLGRGGMGIVYCARDTRIGRTVALKTLTETFTSDDSMLQRFYREAEKTGRLNHPNIVTIFDSGDHDGHPYIVMEFLVGETLDSIIKSRRVLPLVSKLKIMKEVCLALAHAHANDVIHRDVKPLNVIILTNGSAKLLDFGIAVQERVSFDLSLTQEGSIIGTVPYMAPERLSGATFNGRSDVFAAGVMMFQLLTGSLPFHGATDREVADKILYERQPLVQDLVAGYPAALDEIIGRALEKEPARRYQSANEMATDLSATMESALEQHLLDLMVSARELGKALQLDGAREKLREVLSWNPQHQDARKMLAAVEQRLSQRENAEAAEGKRRLAEQAAFEKRYDAALVLLKEARDLCPENTSLATLMEEVRQKQLIVNKVNELCMEAETARRKGDFVAARAKYEDAMQLDTHNSRLRLAYGRLLEDARQAENQAKATSLLREASASLQRREFRAALASLEQAEALDPTNSQIHSLTTEAQNGLRGEERRAMLADIEMHMASASSEDELLEVAGLVGRELERMPGDASLLRFRLEVDQRMQLNKDAKTVEDTAASCRKLLQSEDLAGARECVRKALAQVPGNGRLLALAERIEEKIRQEIQQSRQRTALLQANEALKRKDYRQAVKVLTECPGDSQSQDVADLLQMAQEQLAKETHRDMLAACYLAAQEGMRTEDYAAVVAAIEPVLEQGQDETLQQLLEAARLAERERATEREQALQRLRGFAVHGLHEQVAAAATALTPRVAAMPEVVALLQSEAQALAVECEQLEKLGEAYRTLTTEDPVAHWNTASTAAPQPSLNPPTVEARMWTALSARRQKIANEVVRAQCVLLQAGAGPEAAGAALGDLKRTQAFAGFAAKEVSREWHAISARLLPNATTKLLRRLRDLRPGKHKGVPG